MRRAKLKKPVGGRWVSHLLSRSSNWKEKWEEVREVKRGGRLTNDGRAVVVWWSGEVLRLCQVDRQEARGRPGDDERSEFDNGEGKQLPGREQFDPPVGVLIRGLPETELRLGGLALAEIWILGGGLGVCELRHGHLRWLLVDLVDARGRGVALVGGGDVAVGGGREVAHLGGMDTMPFGLGEEEDQGDGVEGEDGDVEPPEGAPTDSLRHGTGDDGAYHQGAEVGDEVTCIVLATVVQEEQVGNDGRADGLRGSCTESIETIRCVSGENSEI